MYAEADDAASFRVHKAVLQVCCLDVDITTRRTADLSTVNLVAADLDVQQEDMVFDTDEIAMEAAFTAASGC